MIVNMHINDNIQQNTISWDPVLPPEPPNPGCFWLAQIGASCRRRATQTPASDTALNSLNQSEAVIAQHVFSAAPAVWLDCSV